jgi:hypothetical protein
VNYCVFSENGRVLNPSLKVNTVDIIGRCKNAYRVTSVTKAILELIEINDGEIRHEWTFRKESIDFAEVDD